MYDKLLKLAPCIYTNVSKYIYILSSRNRLPCTRTSIDKAAFANLLQY